MKSAQREEDNLIELICATRAFKGAPLRQKLLRYLFENRDRFVTNVELAQNVFEVPDEMLSMHDPGRIRERCLDLRRALESYAERDVMKSRLRCEMPFAEAEGYKLKVGPRQGAEGAVGRFWNAHMASGRHVSAVCNPILFYYDHGRGQVVRFVDLNSEGGSRKGALDELRLKHPQEYRSDIMPGHFYIEIGEIVAAERVRDWFERHGGMKVPMSLSNKMTGRDILSASPVLFGSHRVNPFTRRFLSSSSAAGLGFRLHPDKFAAILIQKPTETERESLGSLGLEINDAGDGFLMTPAADTTIGIVTRVPNPGGGGVMTLIASDAILAIAQMAVALTDEDQMKRILARIGWAAGKDLPMTFEWMFLVRLWPGNLDDEAGEAELLAWRMT